MNFEGLFSEKKHANADNADLGYTRVGHNGRVAIGHVDEVNGEGADELPLMPTRHESMMLVKYWAEVALDYAFVDMFLMQSSSCSGSRLAVFARRRIERIQELLGEEAVQVAMTEAEEAYGARCDPRAWKVFRHGSPEEQEAFAGQLEAESYRRRYGADAFAALNEPEPTETR